MQDILSKNINLDLDNIFPKSVIKMNIIELYKNNEYKNIKENVFYKDILENTDWDIVISGEYGILSEDFLREFQDFFDDEQWSDIIINCILSEDFIREFEDKFDESDWLVISSGENMLYEKLSEDFIREFQYNVNWKNISYCIKLSEDFIREFQDNIYWNDIAKYPDLSKDFKKEFEDKVKFWIYDSDESMMFEDEYQMIF